MSENGCALLLSPLSLVRARRGEGVQSLAAARSGFCFKVCSAEWRIPPSFTVCNAVKLNICRKFETAKTGANSNCCYVHLPTAEISVRSAWMLIEILQENVSETMMKIVCSHMKIHFQFASFSFSSKLQTKYAIFYKTSFKFRVKKLLT